MRRTFVLLLLLQPRCFLFYFFPTRSNLSRSHPPRDARPIFSTNLAWRSVAISRRLDHLMRRHQKLAFSVCFSTALRWFATTGVTTPLARGLLLYATFFIHALKKPFKYYMSVSTRCIAIRSLFLSLSFFLSLSLSTKIIFIKQAIYAILQGNSS